MNLLNYIWMKIKHSLRLFPLVGIQGTSKSGPNIYEQVWLSSTGQAAHLTKQFLSLSQRECLSDCFLLFNWPQVYGTELHIILVYDAPLELSPKILFLLPPSLPPFFYSQLINSSPSSSDKEVGHRGLFATLFSSRSSALPPKGTNSINLVSVLPLLFILSHQNVPPKYFKLESFLTLERVIHTVIF